LEGRNQRRMRQASHVAYTAWAVNKTLRFYSVYEYVGYCSVQRPGLPLDLTSFVPIWYFQLYLRGSRAVGSDSDVRISSTSWITNIRNYTTLCMTSSVWKAWGCHGGHYE
jgi:hypothetical protein